jgi:DNA-binding response OmpR family regulator
MKTVLIIEDEPGNMQALCLLFHLDGYQVLEATTGTEARQANRTGAPIDLILSDLRLPDISGLKLARELVTSQPRTPVLIISGTPPAGWSDTEMTDFRALPQDRVDFLEKPFALSALRTRVELLLSKTSQMARRAP